MYSVPLLPQMKSGFINIFGRPNAGKSTLLNALMGEKLAIVSPKVQTTRHRIKGILTEKHYQLIFSDTPGIIEPEYRLSRKYDAGRLRMPVDDANPGPPRGEYYERRTGHAVP